MKKINLLFAFGILLLITESLLVAGLGVSPGRTTLNFEPGLTKEVSFTVINSDHREMTVVFYVRGDLADYVTLNQQSAKFSSTEETKSFSYTVNLPQKIEKPGLHETEIVVFEVPKNATIKTPEGKEVIILDSPSISASLAVISQLYVYVLHPGKYLEAELEVVQEPDSKVRFIIPVTSKGKLGIGNVGATIDIYTGLNEKISTISTNEISLESKERKEIYATWNPEEEGVNPGRYHAVATVTYDGETTYADKNFDVGQRQLEIESINVRDFSLGEIAKFNILVNNNWNEEIKDVSVEIMVHNDEGEVMADFKSANYNVVALGKTEIVSYWDTVGVSEGEYKGKLILRYEDRILERPIKIKVKKNDIEVIGFTGKAVFSKKSKFNIQNILIVSVILLIVINAIWFFLFLRKKKRKIS